MWVPGRSQLCVYDISPSHLRIPLFKTRSLRRLMSDNGMTLEQLKSMAKAAGEQPDNTALPATTLPPTTPSPKLPVERLTNFMDVSGYSLRLTQVFNWTYRLMKLQQFNIGIASCGKDTYWWCYVLILCICHLSPGPVLWGNQHRHSSSGLYCAVWHRLIQPVGPFHPLLLPGHRLLWVSQSLSLTELSTQNTEAIP